VFRFEDPIYLWLLVLIPILALVRFISYRNQRKRLRKFGDPSLLKELMPDVSRFRPSVKFWILEGALALLIVMLARPQMGTKINHEKRVGIETIICMDISNSMMAEDIVPSRLDRSKMMVENLVDHFSNDKIGLIVFAGDAFVQLPITSDYVSAKMFLSSIDPSMMATQGTDIARAIEMATHSFTQEEGIGKAIIVITDGEDHEGGALQAAEAAKDADMRVYVLGVGSTKGAPIPIPGTNDFMTDNTGNTVMSALNEEMCKQVAQAGGGAYIHVENNSAAQEQLDNELDKLAKKETSTTVYSEFDEQFQAFGLLALLLLVLEICILDRKNPLLKIPMMLYGGANLINKVGQESLAEYRQENGLTQPVRYKQYPNEELNARISNPHVEGNVLIVDIDHVPRIVTMPPTLADAYQSGAIPLNTLANHILAKTDQMQRIQITEQPSQEVARHYEQNQEREQVKGIR